MWQKIKNIYHLFVAIFVKFLFFYPSRGIKVIGVTGTDGKTTTVSLIYHILKEAGYRVSMISSIGATIDREKYDTGFHVTTPSSFSLQKFLAKAKNKKSEYFILEVTSHALDQNRIYGIDFEIGVLTNITNEHLDYHKTFDNYLKTKIKLLNMSKICVVNSDDASYTLLSEAKNKKTLDRWITYGLLESSDYNPKTFSIKNSTLLGDFNKYNVLASVATCISLGVNPDSIKKALKNFILPKGRGELVFENEFNVMIDFAHTPSAFESILKAVKPKVKGKLIHVFGSAGDRDVLKRPFLGEISSKYSDMVILTAEDPRKEDVNDIISQIEEGIKGEDCEVIKIPNRKEAIDAAIEMAKKGDLVLITGKAQEASMTFGEREEPWDEFSAVENALNNRRLL